MIDTKAIRSKILDLAMRGQLTEQLPEDGTAEKLFLQIQTKKHSLIKDGIIKKEKPLLEVSEDEIPYELPNNWIWVRMGDYCQKITDQVASGSFASLRENVHSLKSPSYAIMVKTADFANGFSKNLTYTDKHGYDFLNNSNLFGGELILSNVGSVGKCFIVPELPYKMTLAPNAVMVRLVEESGKDYLYFFLTSSQGFNELDAISTGVAVKKFNKTELKKILIPIPPLAEQNRIVEKIKQLFSILDTLDELQTQYADNLTALKSKLIDAAIQGKLTEHLPEDGTAEELYQQIQEEKKKLIKEGKIKKQKPLPEITDEEIPFDIPNHWKWVRMDEIASKVTSGSTPKGGKKSNAYVSNGFPFFREQNIYNDGIHTDGMVYFSNDLLCTRLNSTVIAKDILLNITGGSIGRCALIPDDFDRGSINQHILILRMVKPEIRFYIHKLMCSSYVQNYIKNKSVGDKDGFSGGRCKQMLIPFPPLSEQKRIVQKLDEILPLCEKRNKVK